MSGTVLLSVLLHGLLFFIAVYYTNQGLRSGGGWGKNWDASNAIHVGAVSSLPGVPLPAPMVATLNTVATQNPGAYRSEPPPPPPTPKAEEIPKFQQEMKPEKTTRINKRIQKEIAETPLNAVPFGLGGSPTMTTGQFSNAAGQGDLNFGGGNFGERYGWYVNAVRGRISANWLLSTISPNILSAPRVYLTFDILRDGTVTNVQIKQSSGVPEVDRSALRAALASNPLGPLPVDYPGNKVSVDFYFDFHRR